HLPEISSKDNRVLIFRETNANGCTITIHFRTSLISVTLAAEYALDSPVPIHSRRGIFSGSLFERIWRTQRRAHRGAGIIPRAHARVAFPREPVVRARRWPLRMHARPDSPDRVRQLARQL